MINFQTAFIIKQPISKQSLLSQYHPAPALGDLVAENGF